MTVADPAATAAEIRRLGPDDAEALFRLRRRAILAEPLAFAASPGDDRASSVEAVREMLARGPDSVIFGAFRAAGPAAEPELVAMAGLARDRLEKAFHRAHLWGMFVAPEARRAGLGVRLVEAALAHARSLPGLVWVDLTVTTAASGARRLYEEVGFREWGRNEDTLRHGGTSVGDHLMSLRLHPLPDPS